MHACVLCTLLVLVLLYQCWSVEVGDSQKKFFPVLLANKGDWPYIRKSCHMKVGFTARRICHLCPGDETGLKLKLTFVASDPI